MPQKVHSIKFAKQGEVFDGAVTVTGVILLGEDGRHIAVQTVPEVLVKVGDRVQISYTFTEREALRMQMETHKSSAERVVRKRRRRELPDPDPSPFFSSKGDRDEH